MVIGKGGSEIEKLRNKLNNLTDKKYTSTLSKSKIDIDARLVLENIARQLENRASFRRVQKQAISRAMKLGAKGIKTQVSGRLGGVTLLVLNNIQKELFHFILYVRHRLCTSLKQTLLTVN